MSPRLPALKSRVVIRALERAGFFLHHATGSHQILKHPDRPAARVTVPLHNRDLKRGTLRMMEFRDGTGHGGRAGYRGSAIVRSSQSDRVS